ncbi:MAG: hypothetical protein A6D92_04715 [Symbiobacterium thermophilum]|jgi:hypothetical protein|uniref:DUF4367 domain-containing protein n=1 Tax=Symbiobacterium thermophilum TaxID=2734 RepID=A0A1Y2T5E2_SYMTR|nr:MAG: hypothetical protein A6D92_04715 [Symbiobacterium thermophilum]
MADLEQMIREGFARGLAGYGPSDRWAQIAAALDAAPVPARRRIRRARIGTAAAALAAAALLSLLYPPVRAAAVDLVIKGANVLWQGRLGDWLAVIFVEEPPTPTEPAGSDLDAADYRWVETAAEAEALAGFAPPTIRDATGDAGRFSVSIVKVTPDLEWRTLRFNYYENARRYTLSAEGYFAPDEAGRMVRQTQPLVGTTIRRGEDMGDDVQTVSLGDAEALCFTRDFGRGPMRGYCMWQVDGIQIRLNGPDLDSVIRLARRVTLK